MQRLLFFTGIIALTFAISACNVDQNRHHRGMMQGQSGQRSAGQQFSQESNLGQEPVTRGRARSLAQHYLESTGNTNFILGDGREENSGYEFPLLSQADSSRVARLLVDRQTGEVSSRK